MSRQHTFLSLIAVTAGSIALAGCSGWSYNPPILGNFMTEPLNAPKVQAAAPPAGGNFVQETAHDYAGLSAMLRRLGDWTDVDYFARKGMAAERGEVVPPEDNRNWAIPLEEPFGFRTKMAGARARLVADLDDCWLERTEDDWVHEFDGACHKDFLATIAALERHLKGAPAAAAPAPRAAHQYNVYFDFDQARLTPEGRQVVDEVARTAKAEPNVHIRLVGKADLVGTDPYNMALSQRRADTVRAELTRDGIDAGRIAESWDGFRDPPVPTARGVREPRNRVVEVTLQ